MCAPKVKEDRCPAACGGLSPCIQSCYRSVISPSALPQEISSDTLQKAKLFIEYTDTQKEIVMEVSIFPFHVLNEILMSRQ